MLGAEASARCWLSWKNRFFFMSFSPEKPKDLQKRTHITWLTPLFSARTAMGSSNTEPRFWRKYQATFCSAGLSSSYMLRVFISMSVISFLPKPC